jgi:hypothetical protein
MRTVYVDSSGFAAGRCFPSSLEGAIVLVREDEPAEVELPEALDES